MHRRGLADEVLSECLARRAYHETDDRPEDARLRIDPDDFLARYDRRIQLVQQVRAAFTGLDHIALVYDDDLIFAACQQAIAERMMAAVGLPPLPMDISLRRIGDPDPRDRLENYDEIADALAARGIT